MLRRRYECCRLWSLGMLPNRMLVNMLMEVKQDSRMSMVVWDMVLHGGMYHWVMQWVMVMVMVMGPKRWDRHWQGAQRWGHRE